MNNNGIIFNNKKGWNSFICSNRDGVGRLCSWSELSIERKVLYFFIYIWKLIIWF